MQRNGKKQTSIYLYEKDCKEFQRRYPHCLGTFIQKAINLAITNNNAFAQIISYERKEI